LARAVAQRGGAAARGPLLQRTVDTAKQALQEAGYTKVSIADLNRWLSKTTGSGRTKQGSSE